MKLQLICLYFGMTAALSMARSNTLAQTIWEGPYITIAKANNADWTLAENQDRITDNIWITRRNAQGIFNIASENFYWTNVSPAGTEWSFGTTENIDDLNFADWRTAVNGSPPEMIDQPMVLHLIDDDIYIDILFVFWQQNSGGGFSYKRRTPTVLGGDEKLKTESALVFPNPTSHELRLTFPKGVVDYKMTDFSGRVVLQGRWNTTKALVVENLSAGVYVISTTEWAVKWIKID